MDQCQRFLWGNVSMGINAGVLLEHWGGGPLRSFPLARGDWSRARSSSCVSTSLPVPESSGCPGVPVLWVGWSFGAPLQPAEPFSWFWAAAKTIVAISITAAKADVTSTCIIVSRRGYPRSASVAGTEVPPSVLYRHRPRIEGAMGSAQVDRTFRMPSWTLPSVGGLLGTAGGCRNCCFAGASQRPRSACQARSLAARVPRQSAPRHVDNSNTRRSPAGAVLNARSDIPKT